jgi:hypothetical protein
MNYSLKAKCTGCKALNQSGSQFSCAFNLPIIVEEINGAHFKPTPDAKCYKPKSSEEYTEARRLMKDKITVNA